MRGFLWHLGSEGWRGGNRMSKSREMGYIPRNGQEGPEEVGRHRPQDLEC